MTARRFVLIGTAATLAAALAVGAWMVVERPRAAVAPVVPVAATAPARNDAAPSSAGPTAADEGDLIVPGASAAPSPAAPPPRPSEPRQAVAQPHDRRDNAHASGRSPHQAASAPAAHRQAARPAAGTGMQPADRDPRGASQPSTASNDAGTAASGAGGGSGASTPATVSPPAGESGGVAVGPDTATVPPVALPAPRAPVLVPPRVVAVRGAVYPGDAFRLTVRRVDLGAAAVVEGSEGTVGIRALVLASGDVQRVEVTMSSGSDALDRAAAQAVRSFQFAPATRDGTPIDAYVTLKLRYVVR
jgi:periplasmic protein TonB